MNLRKQIGCVCFSLLVLLRVEQLHRVCRRVHGLDHIKSRAVRTGQSNRGYRLSMPIAGVPADVARIRRLLQSISILFHGEAAIALCDEDHGHVLLHPLLLEDGQGRLRCLVAFAILLVGKVYVGNSVEHACLPSSVFWGTLFDVSHERKTLLRHAQGLRVVILRKIHGNQRIPSSRLPLPVLPSLEAPHLVVHQALCRTSLSKRKECADNRAQCYALPTLVLTQLCKDVHGSLRCVQCVLRIAVGDVPSADAILFEGFHSPETQLSPDLERLRTIPDCVMEVLQVSGSNCQAVQGLGLTVPVLHPAEYVKCLAHSRQSTVNFVHAEVLDPLLHQHVA
mmetsp:Transcript_47237/g.109280  ORF Transcript_47237/g.109280 Transcript_47237/m.109280 type:complete len:338 (-) Transcript_47237:455-1468(-)